MSGTGGIADDLVAEARVGTYPATAGFLCLLAALVRAFPPTKLGAGYRVPGIRPYVSFVAREVLLPSATRTFVRPGERATVVALGIAFLLDCCSAGEPIDDASPAAAVAREIGDPESDGRLLEFLLAAAGDGAPNAAVGRAVAATAAAPSARSIVAAVAQGRAGAADADAVRVLALRVLIVCALRGEPRLHASRAAATAAPLIGSECRAISLAASRLLRIICAGDAASCAAVTRAIQSGDARAVAASAAARIQGARRRVWIMCVWSARGSRRISCGESRH